MAYKAFMTCTSLHFDSSYFTAMVILKTSKAQAPTNKKQTTVALEWGLEASWSAEQLPCELLDLGKF